MTRRKPEELLHSYLIACFYVRSLTFPETVKLSRPTVFKKLLYLFDRVPMVVLESVPSLNM